jgi:hypothetical protein
VQTLHTNLNFRSLFKAKRSNPPLINCIQNSSSSIWLVAGRHLQCHHHSQRALTDQYGTGRAETSCDNRARQRPSNGPTGPPCCVGTRAPKHKRAGTLRPKRCHIEGRCRAQTDSVSRRAIKSIAAQHRFPKHFATPTRAVIRLSSSKCLRVGTCNIASHLIELLQSTVATRISMLPITMAGVRLRTGILSL